VDFYTGRVLRLDMTALTATVERLDEEWARLYVGGKGLLLRYLFAELAPGTDALSPKNPLILASGPFAGTAAATCSRLAVGCKSPATGTLLDSYVGGSFAPELKFAGYDLVVVTGRAPHPVLVLVEDDRVDFLPAEGRFWGLETAALEQLVREEMGPWHKVLSTGPAGERLVPFACLSTDQYHKAGRGGAGAVMGSKNLKAVVVRGTGAVTAGDAAAFAGDMLALQNDRILTEDNAWTYEEGTPFLVGLVNAAGALPTRNWRTGQFESADHIDSAELLKVRTKIRACTQCPLACRQVHQFGDHVCEGPEFETLGLCGANCGISDLATIAAFNRACDELGLDTMSTGAVVALAMDLCERGAAAYGLAFGEAGGYLAAPGLIARREGWGAALALGARASPRSRAGRSWRRTSRGSSCRPTTRAAPSAWGSATPPQTAAPATCARSRLPTTFSAARRRPTRWRASRRWSRSSRTSAPSPGRVSGAPTCISTPIFWPCTSVTCGVARRPTRSS
jgi:aldehyde:ferredoxin oxidoreductase